MAFLPPLGAAFLVALVTAPRCLLVPFFVDFLALAFLPAAGIAFLPDFLAAFLPPAAFPFLVDFFAALAAFLGAAFLRVAAFLRPAPPDWVGIPSPPGSPLLP